LIIKFVRSATANKPAPEVSEAHAEIQLGLTARQKHVSPKHFYDERGSRLFDQICRLPEYYLTRTELQLMDSHFGKVASLVRPRVAVIKFGAGSNVKVRKLLDPLPERC
jgi:uncharacterized SAM-dependent methyltransferase